MSNRIEFDGSTVKTINEYKKFIKNLQNAGELGAEIVINLDESYPEFCSRLGLLAFEEQGLVKDVDLYILAPEDKQIYQTMGVVLIQELVPQSFYIKDNKNMKVIKIEG